MLNNKYDPRLKKQSELQQTFICGESVLEELAAELEPGKKKELSRQSWIITGARGAGKSHLLALLYYRVKDDKKMSKHWLPILFPEELFQVDSLYRLLLYIFDRLTKGEYSSLATDEIKEKLLDIKKVRLSGNLKEKKEIRHRLAKELFDLLKEYKKATGKSLILMLENLQYLFRDQLNDDDMKLLRSFMNEHPGVFIIIGTALTVFDEITDYGKPFYHFFRIRGLQNLERQEMVDFLLKMAQSRKDEGIDKRMENNRRYIYLYHILTGGNPRLILFLYELLLNHDILDTPMILNKITELTPYFLDKTRDESGQRKLILDALATEAPAQTVTDIAAYINEDYKSIAEQVKRLAAEGWVREISLDFEGKKKKESFYTLRDYFYRVWYKVRTKGIEESEIACMADLAVFLFEKKELEERLEQFNGKNKEAEAFYQRSLEMTANEVYMRNINMLLSEARKYENEEVNAIYNEIRLIDSLEDRENILKLVSKLSRYTGESHMAITLMGVVSQVDGDVEKAINYYQKALTVKPDFIKLFLLLGQCCFKLEQYDAAYSWISKFFKMASVPDINDMNNYIFVYIFKQLRIIAQEIFDTTEETQHILNEDSSILEKMESLCRLLLLQKFEIVFDVAMPIIEAPDFPVEESWKLRLFLEAEILERLSEFQFNPEVTSLTKNWVCLLLRRYHLCVLTSEFWKFIFWHLSRVGKGKIAFKDTEPSIRLDWKEGSKTLKILVNIIGAVETPDSREAQQWMADPLFAEIVEQLSQ